MKKPRISILLYCVVILFNLSSWIDIGGVWAELPLLVPRLPEGWALPSQLSIITQMAAIGPVIYFIANTIKPGLIKEYVVVYTVISVGFVGCILLMFFWDRTAYIAGEERSIALLALSFLLSFTDNTSTIVFLSYFAILPADYLSAYYIGEALCGFIPSIASLIQGSGDYDCVNTSVVENQTFRGMNSSMNGSEWEIIAVMRPPTFSIAAFFGILAFIMATSGVSFTLINYHPWFKKFHIKDTKCTYKDTIQLDSISDHDASSKEKPCDQNGAKEDVLVMPEVKPAMSMGTYIWLLVQYGYLQAARYGLLNNIQTYALLPYGALAYSLGNRLSTVVQTLACIVALFKPSRSVTAITIYTIVGTVPGIYIVVSACMSPDPPLKGTTAGLVITILAWLTMSTVWGYCKVGIAVLMQEQGKRHLVMTGAVEVFFLSLVSILVFVLVNVAYVFQEPQQCPKY